MIAYYHLHNIASIRRSLTNSACKIIVHSLVISRLDFGNATLYGISDALLHRLQVLQNSAARLITGTRRREHISPVLFALHWLPIRFDCHNHNVRMKTCNFKIKFSRTTKKSECITIKGPNMWNDMPTDIKVCKSMFTFKNMYKALLLQPYQFG